VLAAVRAEGDVCLPRLAAFAARPSRDEIGLQVFPGRARSALGARLPQAIAQREEIGIFWIGRMFEHGP